MGNQSSSPGQVVSLPKGGGALSGIGEKFSPDLHTGTGNFTVPIALPPGRNGFQPELNLVYSTGNGNGPFGLGWSLSIPGVSRKTSDGVPLYNEATQHLKSGERQDVFILSGAEDLVPVKGSYPEPVEYRPRTEGLFARITHHRGQTAQESHWKVESKDGLVSTYGQLPSATNQPAVIAKPDDPSRIFAWKLTETRDPFGNRIAYGYKLDDGLRGNQLLLQQIGYVDYGDPASPQFLVKVLFEYEERPDPFSDYRAGFEIRTTRRCTSITVSTHTDDDKVHPVRKYHFTYTTDPNNGVSLLQKLDIIGYDDEEKAYEDDDSQNKYAKLLPPLTFGYTRFDPQARQFEIVEGRDLPTRALGAPDMELVDLHGSGLPDILEMNSTVRYWRNLGNGRFDMPRPMKEAPAHALADPGVQMLDANGDGRMDLLVTSGPLAGYYPLEHDASWSRKSFQRYRYAPSFSLDDPEVKLVDMDGDGYTDILRSGSRMECFFNDPDPALAWQRTNFAQRQTLDSFPNVNFSDPRVRLADMSGDGLPDIVLIHDGNIEYWPNLGHNRWGKRLSMRHAPRFPYGYDPQRILLGDVDGDGLADLIYVEHGKVMLWLNHSGNGWSEEPVVIQGTPPVTNMDHVRLMDLHGTGVSGVLWSTDATALSRHRLMFLDFTGGRKPYVLNEMNNHMGAVTRVEYRPSTYYYLQDQQKAATRWRTPLPFPVQVVARVEVIDEISLGKLTTEYRYHHGYWDGAEREFRGFGMVEQLDTENFADYNANGLHGDAGFKHFVDNARQKHFSQPTLTKTWFHQGPVGEEFGDWEEVDYTQEYWQKDPQLLGHTEHVNIFLNNYNDRSTGAIPSPRNRRIKRDALRTMRGSVLRSELYALDGGERQARPYTVTEHAYGLEEIQKPGDATDRKRVFFPHLVAQRTTQWERGDDPMTSFSFTSYLDENGDFDSYGRPCRQSAIAMPRLIGHQESMTAAVLGSVASDKINETHVLATHSHTEYANPQTGGPYIHDRVAQARAYELIDPPQGPDAASDSLQEAMRKQRDEAERIHVLFEDAAKARLIGHEIHYYDGPDFDGEPLGQIGQHGALIRSQTLVVTGLLLEQAYGERRPDYLDGTAFLPSNAPPVTLGSLGYRKQPANAPLDKVSYYADTLRQRLSPRGLPVAMQDALGHETTITYDLHHLLPIKVTDAKGMAITASYNMRLLQPDSMTEPNGTSTHMRYNAIGLPSKQFVVGLDAQRSETLGGTEQKAEITFDYNFRHFEQTGKPIFVHSSRRIHHASENLGDDIIQSREYSDGFGRLIQTRAQAENLVFGELGGEVGLPAQAGSIPVAAVAHHVTDSVVVSGWDVFDNKGQVVEKYEPFFSQGWDFQPEDEAKKGQHASLFYDPRAQVIRTLNPDGTQQRVIFGRPIAPDAVTLTMADLESQDVPVSFMPSPWESYTYDGNDLATLTHPGNNSVPASHHFTPASVVLDGLGRTRCTVVRNGPDSARNWFITRSTFDIRGNLLTVIDTLGRTAFTYHYDLLDRALAVDSIDAGRRTSVFDAMGNLIEYRDSKGSLTLHTYDELNRPKTLWGRNESGSAFTLRERVHYGDEGVHALARQHNTLGKPISHYDEAGLLEMPEYDFKGNLLEKSRRTIKDSELANGWLADWSAVDADEDALEDTAYRTSSLYDALNRPTEITYPQDVDGKHKKLTPQYNRAGALKSVKLDNDDYVKHIAYNARGQRALITYGNGIMTRHAYDGQTFRLARLCSEHFTLSEDTMANTKIWNGNGQLLQDYSYGYDLTGNIIAIDEQVANCGISNSLHGRDRLLRVFSYDPTYRLLSATGRASDAIGNPRPFSDDSRAGFYSGGTASASQHNAPDLTEHYTETYAYDPAGNMLGMHYSAASGQWSRRFGMSGFTPKQWHEKLTPTSAGASIDWGSEGNRLTNVGDEDQARNHLFDANGNLIRQNIEKHHTWDHADRMIGYRVQANVTSPPSIQARYLYGADGMRVKKWVRDQQGQVNTTHYIDGLFEQHSLKGVSEEKTNNILHVMDDRSRIALVRIGSPLDDRDVSPQMQYHLGNHLGSSHIVLGGNDSTSSAFINREEYFPYGETSFGSFGKKRYRYSSKERDEESGLYYFGARYYASYLARWVSCDPLEKKGGLNQFRFNSNSPVVRLDPDGMQDVTADQVNQAERGLSTGYRTTGSQSYYDQLTAGNHDLSMDFQDSLLLTEAQHEPVYELGIAINISSTKSDAVDPVMNVGHVVVYVEDSGDKTALSFGPKGGVMALVSDIPRFREGKLGGNPRHPLKQEDKYVIYEWNISHDQYVDAKRKIDNIVKSPGVYSPERQCTSVALEVAKAAGVSVPEGKGVIDVPTYWGGEDITTSTPFHLNKDLQESGISPELEVRSTYFNGLFQIE